MLFTRLLAGLFFALQPTQLSNTTQNSTPYFRHSPSLARAKIAFSPLKPFLLKPHYSPSQPARGAVLPQAFHSPNAASGRFLQPLQPPCPAPPAQRPNFSLSPPPSPFPSSRPSPAGAHIFRCRSNSAFFSSSSRFCFSSRLLRLLTVRPKMSMRSGGDEARSRSRSRRDTAVLVERERDRDSRRRFRLLSRDLERFRTRSLSRDRDRDRLRFLLCLLLLVCLERDELRLRDRPILPGDAVTNRWPPAPHAPSFFGLCL